MFLSMNWISDFVDFTGLDKVEPVSYTHLDVYKRQTLGITG